MGLQQFFLILSMLILSTMGIHAQWNNPRPVQKFEGELRLGITTPLGGYKGFDHVGHPSISMALELRYNLPERPIDVGLTADWVAASHSYRSSERDLDIGNHSHIYSFDVTADYNLKRGSRVNPYTGLGIGIAHYHETGYGLGPSGSGCVFIPRAGVELWNHLRISASCHFIRRGYNTFEVTLGGVIGGRPKKR